jgi:hypothetical protein
MVFSVEITIMDINHMNKQAWDEAFHFITTLHILKRRLTSKLLKEFLQTLGFTRNMVCVLED